MLAMMPATCGQGRQCNAGKDTSTASAGPSKAKLLWSDAGDGNKAISNDKEMARTPHTPTCRDCGGTGQMPVQNAGSDAGDNEGENASTTKGRCPHDEGDNAGIAPAIMTVRCWQ
jgi:hypothetical protein